MLSSHGNDGKFLCEDNQRIDIERDIIRAEGTTGTPVHVENRVLRKMMKVVLIEACRGPLNQETTDTEEFGFIDDNYIPPVSNMLVHYATIPGYTAKRYSFSEDNVNLGRAGRSVFLKAWDNILKGLKDNERKDSEIGTLCNKVNNIVCEWEGRTRNKKTFKRKIGPKEYSIEDDITQKQTPDLSNRGYCPRPGEEIFLMQQ